MSMSISDGSNVIEKYNLVSLEEARKGGVNGIHTTIGLYPNGSYKVNGVREEDLDGHVKYNLDMRPGRALYVNGKCVYEGMISMEGHKRFVEGKLKWIGYRDRASEIYE